MPQPVAFLTIDLDAIAGNWRTLCARHAGAVGAVLKADAYGLGAARVGARLARAGCAHFFVAHLAEAIALRPHVGAAIIAVLDGVLANEPAEFVAHGIVPVLSDLAQVERWREAAARAGQSLPAMLHLDTGMSRLGLSPADAAALAQDATRLRGIALTQVMTHLVSAELPDDPINAVQLNRFNALRAALPAAPSSLANSSGIFLGPEFASDLARPGAALHGINPTPGRPNPMAPVVRLDARVLQLREIAAGEGVGYNATWRAARPSRIATVAAGYADGYLRGLSNRGVAHWQRQPLPMAGRVSMDLLTFDATDHPALAVGDLVQLIGPDFPPDAVATAAGTNGYEVLTSLGPRYTRRYLEA